MKNKKKFFMLLALPIIFSILSLLGALFSFAHFDLTNMEFLDIWVVQIVATIAMLLGGTYLISYLIAFFATKRKNEISLISYLPLLHIGLWLLFMFIWLNNLSCMK